MGGWCKSNINHFVTLVFAPTANLLIKQKKEVMKIEFGKELRKWRKRAGMSQEDIALELHMSISNISRIETGKYQAKAIDVWNWMNITGSQEILAAMILGLDVAVLQQALESVSSFVATIFLGGIL